jgi:RNA polymerase sigma-70 factor (ECF subfamily)
MEHASHLTPDNLLRHEAFVLRLARTLVRGEADAEDVAQRTLASALEDPPEHGGVRSWLARVTRNHATDLHRSARRRTAREERAARPEAIAAGDSALEQLELQNVVVRAVLALDEPYRGVVVATYYEGRTPAQIAAQRGVPAGTVRSQLSRAHEMLRAKLDRERGDRDGWMRGLTGLLALRGEGAAAATTVMSSSITWPLVLGAGVAACAIGVLVLRVVVSPADSDSTLAVAPLADATLGAAGASLEAEPAASARVAVASESGAGVEATSTFVPAQEPAKLLEQSRQIKKLILDRRLAVSAEERALAGIPADTATSGVVRLLDRDAFGSAFSLPWMREGGSYYSFTERVHDYNRRPQISLQGSSLDSAFYGGSSALFVDLGVRGLADVTSSVLEPSGLSPSARVLWKAANARVAGKDVDFHAAITGAAEAALAAGEIDETTAAGLPASAMAARPRCQPGRAFLLRTVSAGEHDVLVACQVITTTGDSCTLAYRILESTPVDSQEPVRVPRVQPGDVAPAASALSASTEGELRAALARVRAQARTLVFETFSPDVEKRFGTWRARSDGGLVRLVPYFSEWSELTTGGIGGAHYAFLPRSHDAQMGDVSFQDAGRPQLGDGLYGGDFGLYVDLGTVDLDVASLELVASAGDAGALVATTSFSHPTDLPAVEPGRLNAVRAARERVRTELDAFRKRGRELGIGSDALAIVGRTFALRSVRPGSHDVLAAVHVAALDELGVVIAWRILRTWPVSKFD